MRAKLAAVMLVAAPLLAAVAITPTTAPDGTVGSTYAPASGLQFTAYNPTYPTDTYTWTSSGLLPYGLMLSGGGLLSGTPEGCSSFWNGTTPCNFGNTTGAPPTMVCNNGTFNPMVCAFTIQATGSSGPVGTLSLTVSVYWMPQLTDFLTNQFTYFSGMAQSAGPSVPPIVGGGHLTIANPRFRTPIYDNLGDWDAWVDAMNAAGMRRVDIEVDLECLVGYHASCIALYASVITHAHQLGMTVSITPEYYSTGLSHSCGDAGCPGNGTVGGIAGACAAALGHAINSTTLGTSYGSGVQDWYNCLATYSIPSLGVPAYQYILQTWLASGDRFVPVHEPTTAANEWGEGIQGLVCSQAPAPQVQPQSCGGQPIGTPVTPSHTTCPQDWMVNFFQNFFPLALTWSVPMGVKYGVTVNASEMGGGSSGYASTFSMQLAGIGYPAIDMGMDMYAFDPPRQSLYASTVSLFQGVSPSGPAHTVFVEEFGPQAWTQNGGSTGGACAIVGLQSCTWNGLYPSFFSSLLSFLASLGVTDASLFGAEALGACTPTYPDNAQVIGTFIPVTQAMVYRQYSLSGAGMAAILSGWNATGLRGCALTGGSLIP